MVGSAFRKCSYLIRRYSLLNEIEWITKKWKWFGIT